MSDRQVQWLRLYEAALGGTAGNTTWTEDEVAENAARIADAAMARLDARTFPATRVEVLVVAAERVCQNARIEERGRCVPHADVAALIDALVEMRRQA